MAISEPWALYSGTFYGFLLTTHTDSRIGYRALWSLVLLVNIIRQQIGIRTTPTSASFARPKIARTLNDYFCHPTNTRFCSGSSVMSFSIALLLFAVASTGTPGPNNLMILSSGLNFGVQRSIPHWLGIISGVPVMMLVLGLGLDRIFAQWPMSYTLIKIIGATYLLYLAAKIALTRVSGDTRTTAKPLTYIQGVLFQWVNPKAWVMSIGAIAAFTVDDVALLPQVLTIAITFMLAGLVCVGSWLFAGSALQRLLKNDRQQRIFNVTMGLILAVSIIPMMAVSFN